jgi:hypothetical protein
VRTQDPKLLYAINGVSAYHIVHGKEESLTPAGPQTLSLLMVPTTSAFADPAIDPEIASAEQDFYLHLHLPPELDLPLPATTQIYHQPPTSYLIPRWDLGPDSGAFTRIEFPTIESRKGIQEDVDTFETILAQCTAFLERAPPPRIGKSEQSYGKGEKSAASKAAEAAGDALPAYNPADYKPGEAYVRGSHSGGTPGQIVLVDEEDGSVIGELTEGFQVVEDSNLKPGSKGLFLPLRTRSQRAALTVLKRSSRDYPTRRRRPEDQCRAHIPRAVRRRTPSGVQELIPRVQRVGRLAVHHHRLRHALQADAEPGAELRQESPARDQAHDLQAGHA